MRETASYSTPLEKALLLTGSLFFLAATVVLATPQRQHVWVDPWTDVPWNSVAAWPLRYRWLADPSIWGSYNCGVQIRSTDGKSYQGSFEIRYVDAEKKRARSSIGEATIDAKDGGSLGVGLAWQGRCSSVTGFVPQDDVKEVKR